MGYPIEEIEGIGPAYAEKLAVSKITTTDHLLEQACSAKGRKAVVEATGLSNTLILKWVNMADLMRITGIGGEYAELLHAAGVDTVKELKHRNAENLAAKMKEVNDEKNLTRQVPSATSTSKWIAAAKEIEPMLTY